ncbi:superoxide dismutase [Fe], chloroplastic isoform X1 [Amborella trichopoda]|uniref:superoxide dismutase [Fe], chloroplastic isoform X1 n=1 Tax=Amborella trichopoda TaxID=13333 RepID=UPI0009BD2900|nr:superoxide dismutase [Fe], chloroplastic isoform X1 [Amborella trichopoda]|eukprot:XP_020520111.1 superoxide dismutase [Fe], chloroplastic isoform X1 [Amborella trichopoda]
MFQKMSMVFATGVMKIKYLKITHRSSIVAQFELKPPPYPLVALEPHLSRQTLEHHWGKHQKGYVENLNQQILGTELDGMGLEDIILASYNKGDPLPAFNNAAQIWNHEFFWESMKPGGGGKPSGDLLHLIERDFGSFKDFLREFVDTASAHCGSGWVWITYKANKLNVDNAVNPRPSENDYKIVVARTPNAVNPLVWDYSPLLTIDVWEHAYYLDYENRRAKYVSTIMEKLVAWDVVSSRLEVAKSRAAERAREEEERKRREEEFESEEEIDESEMFLNSDPEESEAE